MNLDVGESLHRPDRVLCLANVDVFVVGNDVSDAQHGVVVDDDAVSRNLAVLPPPPDFRWRSAPNDAAETDLFAGHDRDVFRMLDDVRFHWKAR